jgi:hypothetical protein
MRDIPGLAIIFSVAIVFILVFYVTANFSYAVRDGDIQMKWRILKWIPINRWRIRLDRVKEVRRFDARQDLVGGEIFGNILSKRVVTLVVDRRFGFKRIFITPNEPELFIEQIRNRKQSISA